MAARGEAKAMLVDGVMMLVCQYFAGCTNGTLTVYDHPILGLVPTCVHCARKMHIPMKDLQEVTLES